MKHIRFTHLVVALALTASLLVQGAIGASASLQAASKKPVLKGTITIGQLASQTGAFQLYGRDEAQGFKAGLAYATKGTMKVDKAKIVVKVYNDIPASGAFDASYAVSVAKGAIENDHADILQCCTSSGNAAAVANSVAAVYKKILMVAPAAADSITGINRYTFRTSRMAYQDALTGAAYAMKKFGKSYMTLAQNYLFGQSQVAAWKAVLDKLGGNDVGDILFPYNKAGQDFTPYIQQILAKKPKWVVLACAGELDCPALAKQLDDQGVFKKVKFMTGLGDLTTLGNYGDLGTQIAYMSVYYYKFPKTRANTYMVKYIRQHFHRPADIFDQDSFAAAQQIVAALKKTHSLNTDKLIKALEGQTVQGPKGPYTIRKADHACLQPMYIAKLVKKGSTFVPQLVSVRSQKQTTPPVQQAHW